MRTMTITLLVLVGLLCQPSHAEEILFNGGWLSFIWDAESQYITIQSRVDVPAGLDESHVWILTVYNNRFEDGLFAWQIHYSEDIDSVLVLPNDFLTARHFTTEQLGIEASLAVAGSELTLRLPILGAIPHLIAAGDLIEVHALWVQQEPLISVTIPAPGEVAVLPPAGGGASIPDSSSAAVSTSPLPEIDRFIQGIPIVHLFRLEDTPIPDGSQRIVLSYTLMRLHENRASEFVRFAHVSYDFDTSFYSYTIDTSNMAPGHYSLLIGSSNNPLSARMELEIVASND